MKKSRLIAGLLRLLVAVALAIPAVAQQSPYTIQVPFRFNVDARVFPSGEYRISVGSPGAVQIHGVDHTASAMLVATFLSRLRGESKNAELVFHRYGQEYFLAQVWFKDTDIGYKLLLSRSERDYATRIPKTDTVLRAEK